MKIQNTTQQNFGYLYYKGGPGRREEIGRIFGEAAMEGIDNLAKAHGDNPVFSVCYRLVKEPGNETLCCDVFVDATNEPVKGFPRQANTPHGVLNLLYGVKGVMDDLSTELKAITAMASRVPEVFTSEGKHLEEEAARVLATKAEIPAWSEVVPEERQVGGIHKMYA